MGKPTGRNARERMSQYFRSVRRRIALIVPLKPLQRAVANFFVDRQIIVPGRAKGIEHARRQQRFHAVRNITRQIKGVARQKLVRHTVNDESHLTFENVDDLLLWVRMRRHGATCGQRCHHLIHVFAMCDRAARDARTNFNRRIFSLHFERLLVFHFILHTSSFCVICEAYAEALLARMVASAFRTCRLPFATDPWQNPAMKIPTLLVTILSATLIAAPSFAQTSGESPAAATSSAAAPSGQSNTQEMMKQMMEMSKLNENHKLLTDLDGNWNYTI